MDFFKQLECNPRNKEEREFVDNFITELTDYLNCFKEKADAL